MSGNVVGPYTAGSQVGQLIIYLLNIYDRDGYTFTLTSANCLGFFFVRVQWKACTHPLLDV